MACRHRKQQGRQYTYMFFIGQATGSYKEHISILSLAAPCRFSDELALSHQ